jgi:hypothetical protein
MSFLSKNLAPNIFVILMGIVVFVMSLEFMIQRRFIEGWITFVFFIIVILIFFKINWDYFDIHSSYGKVEIKDPN